ncbi:MAG: flagellar biosynthesis regulator FlaF [Rhizobiaceae bacterium]
MFQIRYAEIEDDSLADAKERERMLIQRSIDLMAVAREDGTNSFAASEAILFVVRLWSSFLEDLGQSNNELPDQLRASLISIGIWILKEAEAIRQQESDNFDGLIEISEIIRDGIR